MMEILIQHDSWMVTVKVVMVAWKYWTKLMVVEFVGLAHRLLALGLLALIQPADDDALEYYFSV